MDIVVARNLLILMRSDTRFSLVTKKLGTKNIYSNLVLFAPYNLFEYSFNFFSRPIKKVRTKRLGKAK